MKRIQSKLQSIDTNDEEIQQQILAITKSAEPDDIIIKLGLEESSVGGLPRY